VSRRHSGAAQGFFTTMPSTPLQRAGIGWRHPHYHALLEQRPELGFIEVHSENFFADGGAALALLQQAREHYALSLHGVGLSLGSAGPLDDWHLQQLQRLVSRMQPWMVSEHAAYARGVPLPAAKLAGGRAGELIVHANDLLPLPFSRAALRALVEHVDQVQTLLGRRIAIENVSAYLVPPGGEEITAPEVEAGFLRELAERSGCRLLVDVNNLVVNALNAQRRGVALDVQAHCERWLDQIDPCSVAEIHLAGHDLGGAIVIDHHGCAVPDSVWPVYAAALRRFGPVPTLVEWDNHLPPFEELLRQARLADAMCDDIRRAAAAEGTQAPPLPRAAAGEPTGPLVGNLPHDRQQQTQMQMQALARTQGRLLGWLLTGSGGSLPADAPAGLAVYLNNAHGLALRCLGAAYPVLRELVGAESFDALAGAYRRADPPRRGDLADWGGGLADWLAQSAELMADAPYLPDMARLEWALHRAETAPGTPAPDGPPPGLHLLADTDPAELRLGLAAAAQVWISSYPVAAIWQAHQAVDEPAGLMTDEHHAAALAHAAAARGGLMPGALDAGQAAAALDGAAPAGPQAAALAQRSARLAQIAAGWLQQRQPCTALIWRPRWRVCLREIDVGSAAFVQATLAGADLAAALDAALAAQPALDFGRWLVQALDEGLLREVVRR
jgi:uncharacterized protein (UPF0276 family)